MQCLTFVQHCRRNRGQYAESAELISAIFRVKSARSADSDERK